MRRVVFSLDEIPYEYISASCHLPGAYVEFFPCLHCTYTSEEGRPSFVEVFHVANVHNPNVCATLTFTMPAVIRGYTTGCSVEVKLTQSCPNAPHAADHSPRIALHIHTDVFIEALRFLPRSELDNMRLVSRRWSKVIGKAEGTLQQRRYFSDMLIKFYGESSGMLSIEFQRREISWQCRIRRVLTTRGLSQALCAVRSHLRNVYVGFVLPIFLDGVPSPDPPRDVLIDIPLSLRINWLASLLRLMARSTVIDHWFVHDKAVGFGNLPTLARCAQKPHRKLGCVQELGLCLQNHDATWAQLVGLLNQPSVRGFNEITCWTEVAVDTSELRAIFSSWQSPNLHLGILSGAEPQDALLTLPTQLIRDFVALRDVSTFVEEFSLRLDGPENVVIPEMPTVNDATDRRKRFRYNVQGVDTLVRVNVYANRAARECLTVVTFDHLRPPVLFFKGNVSLADLKLTRRRNYSDY